MQVSLDNGGFSKLFTYGKTESLSISDCVAWRLAQQGSRLLLPPIQRSLVWSNTQIVNYWDSLLRGYPAGMMLVHRVIRRNAGTSQGRDIDECTTQANEEDFQLFDGQQRMAAILLGFGAGQLKDSRKLWIDFGSDPHKNSGLRFQLRMSSTGQPFGYRSEAPNQKFELGKRQGKWDEWRTKQKELKTPQQAFSGATGSDLIETKCSIAFDFVCSHLQKGGVDATIAALTQMPNAILSIVIDFVHALEKALAANIVLQLVGEDIAGDQEEYIRLFGRLGQGGTSLSNDELTYSIIKHSFPRIHDRVRSILRGKAGRLVGEVDLVLAALRVAKMLTVGEEVDCSRPSPTFVSQLHQRQAVKLKFIELIGLESETAMLEVALTQVRSALSFDDALPEGLPSILLANLPRELVDVLLLFSVKHPSKVDRNDNFPAFVLYWLLFVSDDGKAASHAFQNAKKENWCFSKESIRNLIAELEKEGIARSIPRRDELLKLREEIIKGDIRLRMWSERFTALDRESGHKPGDALRVLSTAPGLIKRALMWLQRKYISMEFPELDPTSDRDEDLPIDLDHLIPQNIFGFHWNCWTSRLDSDVISNVEICDNFYRQRFLVGDSLGNFRWLAASKNRSRGKGAFEALEDNADLVTNVEEWNNLIPQPANNSKRWSLENIASFQRLIDLRTLDIYERILTESGIEGILPRQAEYEPVPINISR